MFVRLTFYFVFFRFISNCATSSECGGSIAGVLADEAGTRSGSEKWSISHL